VADPDASTYARKLSGKYAHRVITGGIGHNLPQEAPQEFAQALVDVAAWTASTQRVETRT
jgi:pimeloyl-ACP methyl ester carboxylesterase